MLKLLPKQSIGLLSCFFLFTASCGTTTSDSSSTSIEDSQIQTTDIVNEESADTSIRNATQQQGPSRAEVELLDQGESPRIELRIQLDEGEQKATITQKQTISQSGIVGLPSDPIALAYATEMAITITKDGNNFTALSEVIDIVPVDETNELAAQIIPTLKTQIVGVSTTVTLDPTGQIVGEPKLTGIDNVEPQVAQMMEQINDAGLTAPLPVEAVGEGAKWRVTQDIEVAGIEIEQTTTYEITAIDGNTITIKTVATQAVEEGSVIQEQGQELTIKEWDSDATGEMQLDLTKVFPRSTAESEVRQVLETPGGELTQKINISIATEPT